MTKSVRYASNLWFVAVAAGVGETAIRVTEGLLSGSASAGDALSQVAMRTIVYGTVAAVIIAMRGGRNWARWALAGVLGTVGMLSLVVEPAAWLAMGNSVGDAVDGAGLDFYAIAALRAIHIVAVPLAIAAMFTPAANRYFGASSQIEGRNLVTDLQERHQNPSPNLVVGGVGRQSKRAGKGVS